MISTADPIPCVKRSQPFAFRPAGDTEQVIRKAIEATGLSITDLLTRCVERALPEVVAEVVQQRQRAAAQFLREYPAETKSKSK
jgi:hypothetical protein